MARPLTDDARSERARRWTSMAGVLLWLLTLLLLAVLLHVWQTYCEGFGCIGLGILWAMWAAGWLLVSLLALGMWVWRRRWQWSARVLGTLCAVQWLVGLSLLGYWLRWYLKFRAGSG